MYVIQADHQKLQRVSPPFNHYLGTGILAASMAAGVIDSGT